MRIHILVFDGFDELDALAPYEVFQKAAQEGADCRVSLGSRENRDTVTAANGLEVVPDESLPAATDDSSPDLLLVPGGGWNSADGGVYREVQSGELSEAIHAHWATDATIASVCTGAMLLERAGLLEDIPAVTHHTAQSDLADTGVEIVDQRVVDTGDVITAGGISSGLDLGLHLVDREFGEHIADNVAETLEYDWNRGAVARQ
jgi:transcriptional regulator GlxA family with amidase domain